MSRSSAALAAFSAAGSSPVSVTDTLAPDCPSAPNWMRAPGMSASIAEARFSNACCDTLRSPRGTRLTVTVADRTSPAERACGPMPAEVGVPMEAKIPATSGSPFSRSAIRCATASVSASVAPGGSSTEISERPRSEAGMKSMGSIRARPIDPAKNATPSASVIQRRRRAMRSSRR